MIYTHKETGASDTREGWIASYDAQELEARGLTAEAAFDADEGVTLIATTVAALDAEDNDLAHEMALYDLEE
ncbi:MAG: hypothetical protein WC779_08900 [Candidatus Omnitrophota bacterium]|jgi:hypothetical protein